MDASLAGFAHAAAVGGAPGGLVTAHVPVRNPAPARTVCEALGPGPFAAVILFISPEADLPTLTRDVAQCFAGAQVTGCTTAGEISSSGYTEGEIVAVGLTTRDFAVETILIPNLSALSSDALIGQMIRSRQTLARQRPDWDGEFAFLMVDGLSIKEDELTSALAAGLGPVPLFGGSAGDGVRFRETFLVHEGRALRNAAILSFVRTRCRVRVFNIDHLVPTEQRMVVTEADPRHRIVRKINAEPAAREYARILGKDPAQLTPFTFAAHPVVVRVGGKHHVRAIQQVADNGDLVFFSAIDEGLVLTLAEPLDMAEHLRRELETLAAGGAPKAILACDCILRRIEAQDKQQYGRISQLLRDHRVVGFSTYGEQFNSMHVNQTMTGVAIYPPRPDAAGS